MRSQYTRGTGSNEASASHQKMARALGWFSIGLGAAELLAPGLLANIIGVRNRNRTRSTLRLYGIREIAAGAGLLASDNPAPWLWARAGGDFVDLASLKSSLDSPSANRAKLTTSIAATLGVTALDIYCAQAHTRATSLPGGAQQEVSKTTLINAPAEEVYRFWRNFENLPSFMEHLESVQILDDRRSHWRAKAPAGATVEWDAEITEDQPGRMISWRSLENADIENSGAVIFEPAPADRGTYVKVRMSYSAPGGVVGATIAKLFGEEPSQQVYDDLRRFKQIMETGEVMRSDVSIHTGMHPGQPSAESKRISAQSQSSAHTDLVSERVS